MRRSLSILKPPPGDLARRLADHARGAGNGRPGSGCGSSIGETGPSLLVTPAASRSFGPGTGAPIFLLVPQVKLPKRLELAREAKRAHEAVPGLIVANSVESKL